MVDLVFHIGVLRVAPQLRTIHVVFLILLSVTRRCPLIETKMCSNVAAYTLSTHILTQKLPKLETSYKVSELFKLAEGDIQGSLLDHCRFVLKEFHWQTIDVIACSCVKCRPH
ncbi:uncharacterized protein PRCAT00001126001 [Priceomyces carsonii]|uniref:uncharacterized protein n=1 Tax=Priceomyces carsonii TaxID=28549 RepID=UPI002EDB74DA|nr:unnamed protein product [Priceomyces carsonii]